MNQFPFEFTFLDGPALKRYLDVLSVSQEILSVGRDDSVHRQPAVVTGANPISRRRCASAARRSRRRVGLAASDLEWLEAVVSLGGAAATTSTGR